MTAIRHAALAAGLLLSASIPAVEAASQPGAAPPAAAATSKSASGQTAGTFAIGDKLRVSFFEQMDLPATEPGGAATSTFYQRVDLTSDYLVGSDGTISLPRLGRIAAAGRGEDAVTADINTAYRTAMGREGDVHVAILERQPIYVIGPVRSPGAFPYASGMVAIQALALAGGAERRQDQIAPVVEAGRETERSEDARTRLTLLLSRRAWLESVQSGREPVVPKELARLVGRQSAAEMIAAEQRAGKAAAAARRSESVKLAERTAAWRQEMAVLERSLDEIARAMAMRQATIADATEPDTRLSRTDVIAAQRAELVGLEARRSQVLSSIQRIEQQISGTEAERERIALDFATTTAAELVTLTNDVVRLRQTAFSASDIAGSLQEGTAPTATDGLSLSIVRTSPGGVETIPAGPTTRLLPGDVVRVEPAGAEKADAGAPPQKAAGLVP
jgi:protein involved in polysaccharide export with SLBB domain